MSTPSGGWASSTSVVHWITPGQHTVSLAGAATSGTYGMLFGLQNTVDGSWPLVSSSAAFQNVCQDSGPMSPHPLPPGWPTAASDWIWGCGGNPSTVTATFTASLLVYQDTMNNSVITDNCSSYESDAKCSLKDEIVDDVQTYQNYNPTGLSPLPSCRTFTGSTETFNVCHSWWSKTRTYVCSGGNSFDFTGIQQRVTSINASATDGGSVLTYTDMTPNGSGGYNTSNGSIALTPRNGAECPHACKIKRPKSNSQAGTDGNTTQYQTSNQTYSIVYARCDDGGSCPTQAGDIVDIDCQCINEFAEAATILSVLNSAGKDMICSSGTYQ
jgi:hypothetical protein